MQFLRNNLLSFLALLGMVATSFIYYGTMPDSVPIHFNWEGNPNNYASRTVAAVMLPAAFLAVIERWARPAPREPSSQWLTRV